MPALRVWKGLPGVVGVGFPQFARLPGRVVEAPSETYDSRKAGLRFVLGPSRQGQAVPSDRPLPRSLPLKATGRSPANLFWSPRSQEADAMVAVYALALGLVLSAGEERVLLSFYSESCGPCRQMAPVTQRLAAKGHPIRRIDVSREPGTAAQFGVTAVPCFVMLVNGREVARQVGMASESQLERMLTLGQPAGAGGEAEGSSVPAAGGGQLPPVRSSPALVDLLGPSGGTPETGSARSPVPGWRMLNPDRTPPAGDKPAEADMIAATVRIRVKHAGGQSCGSGTIIDARRGEALVLTCGHLFRESQGQGLIEVDIFAPRAEEKVRGTLVHFDADSDLGLVSIRPAMAVRPARVAPPHYRLVKGARVYSAGCDGGAPPTVRAGVITALDRFLGPPNLTATGLPVEGRSGGGLFTAEGFVVGVCNAALPEEKEGFYAALEAIHKELDRANLAFVYHQPPDAPAAAGPMVAVVPPHLPKEMPPSEEIVRPTDLVRDTVQAAPAHTAVETAPAPQPSPGVGALPSGFSPEEKATLAEIQRRRAQGAEIICVIRQRDKPEAPSEIVVLDRASAEFIRHLRANGQSLAASTGIAATVSTAGEQANFERPPAAALFGSATGAVAQSAAVPSASDLPEWKPRWLQPGYQGQ